MSQKTVEILLKKLENELGLIKINSHPDKKVTIIEKLKNGSIRDLSEIPEQLLEDRDVFRELILSSYFFYGLFCKQFIIFDTDFILELLDIDFGKTFRYFNYFIQCFDNQKIALKIIPTKPQYIMRFTIDEEFVFKMMKVNPDVYHHLNDHWRSQRKIMVEYLFLTSKIKEGDTYYPDIENIKEILNK
jgi:hypothetical protein